MPDPLDQELLKRTFLQKIKELFPEEAMRLPGRVGVDDGWCYRQIGDEVDHLGEPDALTAIEAMCVEVGLSQDMIARILARTKQRFAEAVAGKRWTKREIKDAWKAVVDGKVGRHRHPAEAEIDFAVMMAFRSD